MVAVDHPLSVRDSLAGLLVAFRLLDQQLGIDLDATTIGIKVAGTAGEELASIGLSNLLRRADAAVAADGVQRRAIADTKARFALPLQGIEFEPCIVFDATGAPVLTAVTGTVPQDEAEALAAFALKACNAYPALLALLQTAVQALRSYQHGNAATELAREAAEVIEAMLAEQGSR